MPFRIFQAHDIGGISEVESSANKWVSELPKDARVEHVSTAFTNPPMGGMIFAVTVYYSRGFSQAKEL
jgi:hypothetical protein